MILKRELHVVLVLCAFAAGMASCGGSANTADAGRADAGSGGAAPGTGGGGAGSGGAGDAGVGTGGSGGTAAGGAGAGGRTGGRGGSPASGGAGAAGRGGAGVNGSGGAAGTVGGGGQGGVGPSCGSILCTPGQKCCFDVFGNARCATAPTTCIGAPAPCGTGQSCQTGFYCEITQAGRCLASGVTGVCVLRPEICLQIYQPVCGCDGRTYGNDCSRRGAGIQLDHAGPC